MDIQPFGINPYNEIGNLHNKGLTFTIKKLSQITKGNISLEQIINVVCDYLGEINGQNSQVSKAIIFSLIANVLNKNSKIDFYERLKQEEFSKESILMIKNLLKIDSISPDEILYEIDKLEQSNFVNSFNDNEKNYLFLAFAIAKASVQYWSSETIGLKSYQKEISPKLVKFPWKDDVEGALFASFSTIVNLVFGIPVVGAASVTLILGTSIVKSTVAYFKIYKKNVN